MVAYPTMIETLGEGGRVPTSERQRAKRSIQWFILCKWRAAPALQLKVHTSTLDQDECVAHSTARRRRRRQTSE